MIKKIIFHDLNISQFMIDLLHIQYKIIANKMAQNVEIGHVTKIDEIFLNIWFIDKHLYSKQRNCGVS